MYTAIIPAAGSGSRMNLGYNKLLHKIAGYTVIEHTVRHFLNDIMCRQIIITSSADDLEKISGLFYREKRIEVVLGDVTRQESICQALEFVKHDIVLIHDGARPFINKQIINDCADLAATGVGAITGVKIKDTIKKRHSSNNNMISQTLNRDQLIAVQTPQAFPTDVLKKAYALAKNVSFLSTATDDAMIVEKFTEIPVMIVEGDYKNLKFTTTEDLEYFEFLLRRRF